MLKHMTGHGNIADWSLSASSSWGKVLMSMFSQLISLSFVIWWISQYSQSMPCHNFTMLSILQNLRHKSYWNILQSLTSGTTSLHSTTVILRMILNIYEVLTDDGIFFLYLCKKLVISWYSRKIWKYIWKSAQSHLYTVC